MRVGMFIDEEDPLGRPWFYPYNKLIETLDRETQHDVDKVYDVGKMNEYDIGVIQQNWGMGSPSMWQAWARNEEDPSVDIPIIAYVINSPENPPSGGVVEDACTRASAVWNAASYTDAYDYIDTPTFWFPFCTWTDERYNIDEKDNTVRAAMTNFIENGRKTIRLGAVNQCSFEVDMYGGSQFSQNEKPAFYDLLPSTFNYVGYDPTNDIFENSKFFYEALRSRWLVPKSDPQPYWSDRIMFCLAFGVNLITNYSHELDKFESTIDYHTAREEWERCGTLEALYDHDAIERDRDNWSWKSRAIPIVEETVSVINNYELSFNH